MSDDSGSDQENVSSRELMDYLVSNGYATPTHNNKCKVSRDLLSSIPFPPGKNVDLGHMVEIPVKIDSPQTYEYMGFTAATSQMLYGQYYRANQPTYPEPDIGMDFLQIALDHIDWTASVDDAETSTDDWRRCLDGLGINAQVANGIMHPDGDAIRYAHTCKFWITRAVSDAYCNIEGLDGILRQSTALLREHAAVPSDSSGAKEGGIHPSSTHQPASVCASEPMPDLTDHHTTLWRGGGTQRQLRFYSHYARRFDNGAPSLASSPGDFGRGLLTYWSPQREFAEEYRRMSVRTHPDMETCLIQIAVPEDTTSTMTRTVLYSEDTNGEPNDEWKQVIWHSRCKRSWPHELERLECNDIIIGHVSSGKHVKYTRIPTFQEIQTSDRLIIKTGSGQDAAALQWVFQSERATDEVENNIIGKVWFHRWDAYGIKVQQQ